MKKKHPRKKKSTSHKKPTQRKKPGSRPSPRFDAFARTAPTQKAKWVDDPHRRYEECVRLHPRCHVRVRQTWPALDDSIEDQPVTRLRSLDDVKTYLLKHWDGNEATYEWSLCDDTCPQWARGELNFKADAGRRFVTDLIAMLKDVDDGSWDKETLTMVGDYARESARQLGLMNRSKVT